MSTAQWLMEYRGLHDKEIEDAKVQHKILRMTMIELLGVGLHPPIDENGEFILHPTPEQIEANVRPLVLWMAHPELIEALGKETNAYTESRKASDGSDTTYEETVTSVQEALERGEVPSDMDPLLFEPSDPMKSKWESPEMQADLKSLVTVLNPGESMPTEPHLPSKSKITFEE
jgi:hypothetical protein